VTDCQCSEIKILYLGNGEKHCVSLLGFRCFIALFCSSVCEMLVIYQYVVYLLDALVLRA